MAEPRRYRILFVDDEPRVLSGLRRMLRGMRDRWDMSFVDSPVEALRRVLSEPFDVIVADMKMPKLTGTRLLEEIRKRRPETTRVILSGETERENILGALGTVHQFLAKPCDAQRVQQAIERAVRLRERLADPALDRLLRSIEALPSPPAYFTELVEALEAPEADLDRVCDLICRDPNLLTRILRLVNSALFGLRTEVTDIRRAITLLGFDVIRSLAVSTKVLANYRSLPLDVLDFESAWAHSVEVASTARELARSRGLDESTTQLAFLGGLLHDSGKLALASGLAQRYAEVLDLARTESLPDHHAEQRLLGASHAEIGGCLLGLWGLPEALVDVVCHHHDPAVLADRDTFLPTLCVHAADAISHLRARRHHHEVEVDGIDWDALAQGGLAEEVRQRAAAATTATADPAGPEAVAERRSTTW